MRKIFWIGATVGLVFIVGVAIVLSAEKPDRYIVKFSHTVGPADEAALKARGIGVLLRLDIINGLAVLATPGQVKALEEAPDIVRIEKDAEVHALGKPPWAGGGNEEEQPPPQETPWGVDRIDADLAWGASTGELVKVGVLDTGIDRKHPDLDDNVKGAVRVAGTGGPGDQNGHGTHVAGIIAAEDNEIGVVGVAPDAWLYDVKVLNKDGVGYVSWVIAGIQWCIDNGMQVTNMSLGTSSDVQSLHDAIIAADNAGIIQVAAAGNEYGGDVIYPAAYDETIAVSATDDTDGFASFSSAGPEIDFAAPGVDIRSTYLDKGYATLSGTSMATPHTTGTVALVLSAGGSVETGSGLQTGDDLIGEDIGLLVEQQGEGLVDAEASVGSIGVATKPIAPTTHTTWGKIKEMSR